MDKWDLFTHIWGIVSLALGKSYDCSNLAEVILKGMGRIDLYQTTTKHIVAEPWA